MEIEYEDLILLLNEEELKIKKLSAASKAQLEVNSNMSFCIAIFSIFRATLQFHMGLYCNQIESVLMMH